MAGSDEETPVRDLRPVMREDGRLVCPVTGIPIGSTISVSYFINGKLGGTVQRERERRQCNIREMAEKLAARRKAAQARGSEDT